MRPFSKISNFVSSRTFLQLSLFSLILISASCHGGGGRGSSDSIPDSLAKSEAVNKEELYRLPDTVYASADDVYFEVTVSDSTISGELNSLEDLYKNIPGAFTFRKGSRRQADFGGKVDKVPTTIEIDWTFKTAESYRKTSLGTWGGGTGWSGEPVYVDWPDSLLAKMKSSGAVYPDFSGKEIIFGSLSGVVYFVDLETGKQSRQEIDQINPVKGSVSLDPTLNGNLYVGQGVAAQRPWGVFMVNLFDNKVDFFLPEDPKAWRKWGAYDSSSVRAGQFLFLPGENGSVYKYYVDGTKLTRHSVLRYKVSGAAPGIESSMAIYMNYGVIADNHGNIIALNLDTMKPVWLYRLGDDIDSTPVVSIEDGVPYIYTGCEIDRQGISGDAYFVKLDLRSGKEIWKNTLPGKKFIINEKHFDGGYYATALLGEGNCEDRIFALCVKNTDHQNGELIAFEKKSGKIIYETPLQKYAWSSPVGFMSADNKMTLFVADCAGNVYLVDGEKGNITFTEKVGANFESSPVVMGNSLVVGSRGNSIFKMSLK